MSLRYEPSSEQLLIFEKQLFLNPLRPKTTSPAGARDTPTSPLRYFSFFTSLTGPRRSFSLKLSGTRDFEP